jgi:dipeptidyl aminopeptidase/acylaminoacyl peptidase
MKSAQWLLLLPTVLAFSAFSSEEKKFDSIDQVPLIPRTVLFNNPEKMRVRISPNGQRVAYLAPHKGAMNIWIKTIGEDNDQPITQSKSSILEFCWAYNNQHILFAQDNSADERFHIYRVDISTMERVDMTPFDGVNASILGLNKKYPNDVLITLNKKDQNGSAVYRFDMQTGHVHLVAHNLGNIDVWCVDSSLHVRGAVVAQDDGTTTLLVRKDGGTWEEKETWSFDDSLVGSVPARGSRPVGFSQDGQLIYLISSKDADTQRLVSMNLDTDKKKVLSFDDVYDVDSVSMNPLSLEPDLVCFQKERKEWVAVTPMCKKDLETILSIDKGELTSIDRSADDNRWVICFGHDNEPCSYYLYTRPIQKATFLFYDNKALNNYTLAKTSPISFKSRDGLTLHGYLTCPPLHHTKKLPLVLVIHGGPWFRDVWGYDLVNNAQVQLLANRGYACLQINFRGSSGYGKTFLKAGDRQWSKTMHSDLVDAVKWAIQSGIADKDKIAIYGASYGGYAALVGATFTPDVFCCAVDLYGPSNLVTFVRSIVQFRPLGKIKWYKRVGDAKNEEAFLKSCSPLFKATNIKIPVFIAQGANDVRVKQEESDQMVAAMKANGIEYEYMLFPDEGHGFMKPQNRLKVAVGIERFLAKHLGGRVEE